MVQNIASSVPQARAGFVALILALLPLAVMAVVLIVRTRRLTG